MKHEKTSDHSIYDEGALFCQKMICQQLKVCKLFNLHHYGWLHESKTRILLLENMNYLVVLIHNNNVLMYCVVHGTIDEPVVYLNTAYTAH